MRLRIRNSICVLVGLILIVHSVIPHVHQYGVMVEISAISNSNISHSLGDVCHHDPTNCNGQHSVEDGECPLSNYLIPSIFKMQKIIVCDLFNDILLTSRILDSLKSILSISKDIKRKYGDLLQTYHYMFSSRSISVRSPSFI
ncbi:MAG: hypothetical protein N4A32_03315 [Marinifilaceae bacterium]|jgi:hypothetical protein|nr:hypothetical protein [Marinifilaceae bacterium]